MRTTRTGFDMPLIMAIVLSVSAQWCFANPLFNKTKLDSLKQKVDHNTQQVTKAAIQNAQTLVPKEEGVPLAGDLSDADEIALGREWAGRFLNAYPVIKNDSLQRYVNLVGVWVAQQSARSNLPWTFCVITSNDINAFSAPGGFVFITQGLYDILQDEAELAAVLAHEVAHVNLRHHVRLMQKERLIEKGRNTLTGATKQEVLKQFAGKGAEIGARSFAKEAEYQCDRLALEYAASAGYDPYGYIELIDRTGSDDKTDRISLLFKTHPHPRERIAALEKAILNRWDKVKGIIPERFVP